MSEFYEKKGIKKEFSVARTPQQNGVAERRNMTLIVAARTMLVDSKLPTTFWAKEVNTAFYVHNRVQKKVLVQNASNNEPQPSSDNGKKDDEGVNKESGIDDQERPESSTQDVNIVRPSINTASTNVNTGSLNINTISLTGYTQEEGIDYDEVFAPVARIEAIRLFLDYTSFKDIIVYQMDVKSAFLYGKIEKRKLYLQPHSMN
ncbi:putative ribonuclease H-like domain-containing protein [Tanacetum coccineum]